MADFTQDKIFKNVNDEDARILLEILGKKSKTVKIWTKELRLLDPKDYRPDIIVELDCENLIIELQSRNVDDDFSARALTYVSITNRDKDNDKEVGLMVLSSSEKTKTVRYRYGSKNVFEYDVIGLSDLDACEIINNVEQKILNNEKIRGHDLVLYALLPIIDSENMQEHINRVVNNLLKLKKLSISLKELSFGIEWLIVDKYVEDEEQRNIFCDALGDKMSLIHEYGERKEQQGIEQGIEEGRGSVIVGFLKSGMSAEEISGRIGMPLEDVLEIAKNYAHHNLHK